MLMRDMPKARREKENWKDGATFMLAAAISQRISLPMAMCSHLTQKV